MLTGGNPALDLRLLTELLNSNRLDRQELLALSGIHDRQAFLDIAHKIKGAARIVQAIPVDRQLRSARSHLPCSGFAPENVSECCDAVERALLELEQALLQQIGQNDKAQ